MELVASRTLGLGNQPNLRNSGGSSPGALLQSPYKVTKVQADARLISISPCFLRCILALAAPSLCSSRGRAFLISLAFVMAAVGPTANILANLKVMLRSLACGQEVLRQALGQMLDVIMEPVNAIQLAVDLLLQEVRRVLNLAMVVLLRIQEHLIAISEYLVEEQRKLIFSFNSLQLIPSRTAPLG